MLRKGFRFLSREEEIEAWQNRDYNALVESIMPLVYRLVTKYGCGDAFIEDELLSTANLSIVRSLETYDANIARFSTYACKFLPSKLARRSIIIIAERSRQSSLYEEATAEREASEDLEDSKQQKAQAIEEGRALRELMKKLCTQAESEALWRRMQGEKFAAIGQSTGVTRERVRQRCNSAIQKIRKFYSLVEEPRKKGKAK